MPASLEHQKLDTTAVAQGLRGAVDALNTWLMAAAKYNLHVELHAIHQQDIDQRRGRDIYSVTIEKREPL